MKRRQDRDGSGTVDWTLLKQRLEQGEPKVEAQSIEARAAFAQLENTYGLKLGPKIDLQAEKWQRLEAAVNSMIKQSVDEDGEEFEPIIDALPSVDEICKAAAYYRDYLIEKLREEALDVSTQLGRLDVAIIVSLCAKNTFGGETYSRTQFDGTLVNIELKLPGDRQIFTQIDMKDVVTDPDL